MEVKRKGAVCDRLPQSSTKLRRTEGFKLRQKYAVGSKRFRPDQLFKVTEIK